MLGINFLGYGSSSDSVSEGEGEQAEVGNTGTSLKLNGIDNMKKRKFVPKAQQYFHLLDQHSDEEDQQDAANKRKRLVQGESILDNLPPPENDLKAVNTAINFKSPYFQELESRNEPGLEPIGFEVKPAENESDVEELEGAITLEQIQTGQLEGIFYHDDERDQEDLKQEKQKQEQDQTYINQQQQDQFEGIPEDVQKHLNKIGGTISMTEVKAEEIRDLGPSQGANEHDPIVALGKEYALGLRVQAGQAPSCVARRKHQIGSLLYDARMGEMEFLLKESQGKKSKAETEAKYGWR